IMFLKLIKPICVDTIRNIMLAYIIELLISYLNSQTILSFLYLLFLSSLTLFSTFLIVSAINVKTLVINVVSSCVSALSMLAIYGRDINCKTAIGIINPIILNIISSIIFLRILKTSLNSWDFSLIDFI